MAYRSLSIDDERRLLDRALEGRARGRRRPQEKLYDYLEPKLRLCAHDILRGAQAAPLSAMDLRQEGWVALFDKDWAALRTWEPGRGVRLISFAGVVATRRMLSALRQGKVAEATSLAEPSELDAAALVDDLEWRARVRGALEVFVLLVAKELNDPEFAVFRSVYLEHRSPAETAERLGKTTESVRSYQRRLRPIVRATLQRTLSDRDLAVAPKG